MRRRVGPALRLLAGAGLLAALVVQVGVGPVLERLRGVGPAAVVAALLLGAVATVLSAWRWRMVARSIGLGLTAGRAVADCYGATFLNSLLPAGVLGDVHRAVSHGRSEGNLGAGVRAVVFERVAGHLVAVAAVALVLALQPDLLRAAAGAVPGGAVLPAVVVVAALAGAGWLLRTRLGRVWADARTVLRPRTAAGVVLTSAGALACHLTLFVLAARAAGATAPLTVLLPLLLVALLAMTIPLTVGGWGPREAAAAAGFAAVGLPAAEGLAAAVAYGVLALVGVAPGALVVLRRRRAARETAPSAPGERPQVPLEGDHERVEQAPALVGGGERRPPHHTAGGVGGEPGGEQVRPLVGDVVGGAVRRPDLVGDGVQQDRGLQLPGVHVGGVRGLAPGGPAGGGPVLGDGEQGHGQRSDRGLLDDVAQDVVPAVRVDQDERGRAGGAQRGGDVGDDRAERRRGDAHGARPRGVLVGAGDRQWWKDAHGVGLRDPGGHRGRHEGVGGQGQVRSVLLEAPDREQGHGGTSLPDVLGGVDREGIHAGEALTAPPDHGGATVHDDRHEFAESRLTTRHGEFRAIAFREYEGGPEHLALVHGDPTDVEAPLVRMHSECLTGDVFGARRCECGAQLSIAIDAVVRAGRGVIVYLRGHEGRGIGLLAKIRTHVLQDEDGLDTIDSAVALGLPVDVRDFGAAAVVLRHLGIGRVRLLSNSPAKVEALTGYGIVVTELVPVLEPADEHNVRYLTAKRDRLGHVLPQVDAAPDAPRGHTATGY